MRAREGRTVRNDKVVWQIGMAVIEKEIGKERKEEREWERMNGRERMAERTSEKECLIEDS